MKTILIIEDDPAQLSALTSILSERVRVLTALDGKIGWNILMKEHPDLLLLDIMLPGGMNGFELLDQLKRDPKVKDIPVVILTNLDSEEEAARKVGVVDYLLKSSTSLTDIAAKVTALLGVS